MVEIKTYHGMNPSHWQHNLQILVQNENLGPLLNNNKNFKIVATEH